VRLFTQAENSELKTSQEDLYIHLLSNLDLLSANPDPMGRECEHGVMGAERRLLPPSGLEKEENGN
jgi:hypothetical protein